MDHCRLRADISALGLAHGNRPDRPRQWPGHPQLAIADHLQSGRWRGRIDHGAHGPGCEAGHGVGPAQPDPAGCGAGKQSIQQRFAAVQDHPPGSRDYGPPAALPAAAQRPDGEPNRGRAKPLPIAHGRTRRPVQRRHRPHRTGVAHHRRSQRRAGRAHLRPRNRACRSRPGAATGAGGDRAAPHLVAGAKCLQHVDQRRAGGRCGTQPRPFAAGRGAGQRAPAKARLAGPCRRGTDRRARGNVGAAGDDAGLQIQARTHDAQGADGWTHQPRLRDDGRRQRAPRRPAARNGARARYADRRGHGRGQGHRVGQARPAGEGPYLRL